MKIIDCEQGSPQWHAARLGMVTASRMADVTAKTKAGWGAGRANYAAELIAERLTGAAAERFTNAAMQWGTEQEPAARAMYAFMTGLPVVEVGAVLHPSIEMTLASPDGLVGDDGLVEVKCPNTATHIETLLGAAIDGKYIKQMQWQMACCERQWCDFVSFDPRMPADMQIHIQRVHSDPVLIAELEQAARVFLEDIITKVKELVAKYRAIEAAA